MKSGDYDAIVCYSGGKDSTYTLMLAKQKYGLNVLAFTLNNGFISSTAFENIHLIVEKFGIDHITITPSFEFMSALFKASALKDVYNPKSLVRISSVCNSCISLVNITALKLALMHNAPFIIAGFTFGQIPAKTIYYQHNYRFLEESRQKTVEQLRIYTGDAVDRYFKISDNVLARADGYPYSLNLLCLEEIAEKEIYKKITAVGWKAPKDVDGCSSNCRLNAFNNYIHSMRFGYNPYEWELSHLVRNNLLSRDEALASISNQPLGEIDSIMERLSISRSELKTSLGIV